MGLITYFVSCSFDVADSFTAKILALVFPGGAGLIIYIIMLALLKTEEFGDIRNILIKQKKETKTEEN